MTGPSPVPDVQQTYDRVREILQGFQPDPRQPHSEQVQQAIHLARALQERAAMLQTPQEKKQQTELDRMMHHPQDKVTLTQMTDQAFRSHVPHRAVDQLVHILDAQGVPRFFSTVDRTLLKGFQSFGSYLPGVAVPFVKDKMHKETANVILPAERDMLASHLRARRDEGLRMNVNFLGEALLGEQEADRRLQAYLQALQMPETEVISVKISTIYSQIWPPARRHTIDVLCDRLELLFRAAARERFTRSDGTSVPKYVYLDMEEYRDMRITSEVFMRTLDRPGLEACTAGVVLQAYVPDSYLVQQELNAWARQRVDRGGGRVTLRIVKGANMEMERVEASTYGWPQAPFRSKVETDANYKRMLHEGMRAENLVAVRLGIASHNLFDVAYGLVLAVEHETLEHVQFEMLEGMANHQRRALFELSGNVLLYAPACKQDEFIHAIGYLIRRLDENTGPDNFLRHTFNLQVDSPEWERLANGFLESFDRLEALSAEPRRQQDRRQPSSDTLPLDAPFDNEPDTDFSLPQNATWAEEILAAWEPRHGEQAEQIPLVIAGEEILQGRDERPCRDPSRPGVTVGVYRQATTEDVERAVECARDDPDGWRDLPAAERSLQLAKVAREVRAARADLMGAAAADGGKTLAESDPEVSEAVDFLEYYRRAAESWETLPGLKAHGLGVVAVVSPWNFPIAIPCGGIAAALAAGNTVLLKPASDTVLVAYRLCQCFWKAGISPRVLQFVPCSGADGGSHLVRHPHVDAVILTGGTETAVRMLEARPDLNLLAETGGKNATIVTALADRDLAIKHVLHSAFSHSGQKCSATSLLILEDEVYEDEDFREGLCDAVESLLVGSAWDPKHRMGPLIRPPEGALERGLKELEPGESWAVMPKRLAQNPQLYTPGVKWDVQPGSMTHLTELFGPVLGVMRARNLHEAIGLVNQTGYGLTSGLQSLDDREQELWTEEVRAGNLYVNRPTTGAVVLRQPFGGMGKSAFGPGIKAGGPNYVAQFMRFQERSPTGSEPVSRHQDEALTELADHLRQLEDVPDQFTPADVERTLAAINSYQLYYQQEFAVQHDHFRLIGQDNLRRYRTVRELRIRLHPDDSFFEIFARVAAARTAGCRITVSLPPGWSSATLDLLQHLTESWGGGIEFVEETDRQLAELMREHQTERLRYAAPDRVPSAVREAVAGSGIYVASTPVLGHGRIELLWYLEEQSVSLDYHRYGNLGGRAQEERAETL